jgi:hypothetical protein
MSEPLLVVLQLLTYEYGTAPVGRDYLTHYSIQQKTQRLVLQRALPVLSSS